MFREENKKGIFLPTIEIQEHPLKGYICIAGKDFPNRSLIERCLTIKFSREALIDLYDLVGGRTIFHDYLYGTKNVDGFSYWAMGYGGVYSHSANPNAKWELKCHENGRTTVDIRAIREIKKGEEITISYATDPSMLWFDPIE